MPGIPFALQLYTVRDHLQRDVPGTLKRVKEAGYEHVELAGLGGQSAEEYGYLLADAGLSAVSNHFGFDVVTQDTNKVIEDTEALGLAFAVVPWVGGEMCPDKAAWIRCAKAMDTAGEKLRDAGITLCYHNHAHEFERYDGQPVLELIYETAAPENLAAQIDAYWAQFGGDDPVRLLRKYAGRCPLLHVKDMEAQEPHTFTEVGRGILDWPAIFAAAKDADVRWYIVEQDECRGDSLESARISAEFMRRH
jgi:sugar phosphate isomerase/epimerase